MTSLSHLTAAEAKIAYYILTALDWDSPRESWEWRSSDAVARLFPPPFPAASKVSTVLLELTRKGFLDAPTGWPRQWLVPAAVPVKPADRTEMIESLKKVIFLEKPRTDTTVLDLTRALFDWESPVRSDMTAAQVAAAGGLQQYGPCKVGRALAELCREGLIDRWMKNGITVYSVPPFAE